MISFKIDCCYGIIWAIVWNATTLQMFVSVNWRKWFLANTLTGWENVLTWNVTVRNTFLKGDFFWIPI